MEDRRKATACPRCGSPDSVVVRCGSGPHYGKILCGNCRRFLGWAPTPLTPPQARALALPFGRFEGQRVGAVAATAEGREYLEWLLGCPDFRGRLRRAVELTLAAPMGRPTARTGPSRGEPR
jgi:hypothetical protein